eukprot:2621952-Amphidinium_carterae.1
MALPEFQNAKIIIQVFCFRIAPHPDRSICSRSWLGAIPSWLQSEIWSGVICRYRYVSECQAQHRWAGSVKCVAWSKGEEAPLLAVAEGTQ